jgi:beta-glucosidase-like glycosyl hydrolase
VLHGLVLTDSLSAAAIADAGYSVERAAPLAIAAKDDMVLFNSINPMATANAVIASISGAIASGKRRRSRLNEAVAHVLTAKGIDLCS